MSQHKYYRYPVFGGPLTHFGGLGFDFVVASGSVLAGSAEAARV